MPICQTCKGEYLRHETLCSMCHEPLSHCRCPASTAGRLRLCPRCKNDVGVWEQTKLTLFGFTLIEGGILGLLPVAAAVAVWLFWIPREQSGNYFPILTFVCLGMCVLLFFLIYAGRFFWWEHSWAKQIYATPRISLVSLIAITAIGGFMLSPLWVLFYTTVGRPVEFIHKALFALVYVSAFVCLTAAVTLAVVYESVTRLEQIAPPPIFVNTEGLLQIVVDTAIHSINMLQPDGCVPVVVDNPKPVHEVLEALRAPENGGIIVLLRECKRVRYPNTDGSIREEWMEMLWRIQADRWGRVQSLRPGSLEPYGGDKRVFREIGRYTS